ncbi:type II secretion system major pseudopilin GspG [Burkholderia sola]|uniref:type II secretion system major pseudopilin GspG n=1 Tax=Burkholderia sola TaxID=2843302 RepID=UPI003F49A524
MPGTADEQKLLRTAQLRSLRAPRKTGNNMQRRTKNTIRALWLLPLAVTLTACKPATKVADLDRVYTVDEFTLDIGLRQRALSACSTNPGELRTDPNCVNATASHVGAAAELDRTYQIKRIAAAQDVAVITTALMLYRLDNGAYPTQAQGLRALIEKPTIEPIPGNWKEGGYLTRLPNDPWGKSYQFMNPGRHGEIDAYSFGPASDSKYELAIGSWQADVEALEKTYREKGTFETSGQ